MPKTLRYAQRVTIPAPIELVWSYLADPQSHRELHPLIRELTILSEGEGPEPGERFIEFEVLDGVTLLRTEFPVRYQARMIQRPATRCLSLQALTGRLVTTAEWQLSTVEGGTQIDEQVELTASRLLANFSIRQSQRSHMEMFMALQRVCASRERGPTAEILPPELSEVIETE